MKLLFEFLVAFLSLSLGFLALACIVFFIWPDDYKMSSDSENMSDEEHKVYCERFPWDTDAIEIIRHEFQHLKEAKQ